MKQKQSKTATEPSTTKTALQVASDRLVETYQESEKAFDVYLKCVRAFNEAGIAASRAKEDYLRGGK